MRTRLIRIGNSRGVRLPKSLIAEADLTEEVELRVEDRGIIIESVPAPRAGWAEAAQKMNAHQEDVLLDPLSATRFDEEEWDW